jgi:hypothetical protein
MKNSPKDFCYFSAKTTAEIGQKWQKTAKVIKNTKRGFAMQNPLIVKEF